MNTPALVIQPKRILTAIDEHRTRLLLIAIYFLLALGNLLVKLWITTNYFSGTLVSNHQRLLAFQYYNNEQSRIFQWAIPELIHRLSGLAIPQSYALQRLVFVFLAFVCFHLYLRKWFSTTQSMAGVFLLAASMPLVYQDHLQESAPLLMLLFVAGLWLIREKKDWLYSFVLVLGGGLTNETMLILPSVYFFYSFEPKNLKSTPRLVLRTILLALPAFLVQGMIRYITRDRPHLGGAWHLPDNLAGIANALHLSFLDMYNAEYLFPFFLFSIFWLYALLGYKKSPLFLKRALWMVPFFLVSHMLTGIISESRQMVPLAFILIPMGLVFLFSEMPEALHKTKNRLVQFTQENRFILFIIPVYFFLSFIALSVKTRIVGSYINNYLLSDHWIFMQFQSRSFEQINMLQFWIPEFLNRLFKLPVFQGYLLQGLLFLFLTYVSFHLFLRRWFTQEESFAGVLLFASILPATYAREMEESIPLLLLLVILGLWTIRENRPLLLGVVLLIGVFVHPAVFILPVVYFINKAEWKNIKSISLSFLQMALVALPSSLLTGFLLTQWTSAADLQTLLTNMSARFLQSLSVFGKPVYLTVLVLLFGFLVFAVMQSRNSPRFIRNILFVIPLLILAVFLLGSLNQIRSMPYLAILFTPILLWHLFPGTQEPAGALIEQPKTGAVEPAASIG